MGAIIEASPAVKNAKESIAKFSVEADSPAGRGMKAGLNKYQNEPSDEIQPDLPDDIGDR